MKLKLLIWFIRGISNKKLGSYLLSFAIKKSFLNNLKEFGYTHVL